MTNELKRYKITITVTTRDGAFDQTIIDDIWKLLDVDNGERLDSVSLPTELPLRKEQFTTPIVPEETMQWMIENGVKK
jgi:hypothetical protein